MTQPPEGEPVGSLGEEAAKLLGVAAEWARDLDDHIATGDAECRFCPICRTVHAVRQASPEVRTQLATAASSFLQAAAGILAAGQQPEPGSRSAAVEHIDLDADPDPDSEP